MCLVTAASAVLRPVENRYLFILETSKEMKREAEPAQNVLLQLLYSGVMGQMRAGDTFGIWTYNDTLHAGYPMQTFVWEDRESLTSRAGEYIKSMKFTGAARIENALVPVVKLATNSPNLTVILVSDGKQAVTGTPFDTEIGALHKKYYQDLHDSKLPFVTVLVAHHGKFISYAVNSALGPIRVPRLPKPPVVTNAVVKAPTVTNAVVKRGPSLILRGPLPKSKTETTPPAVPVVAPAVELAKTESSVATAVPPVTAPAPSPAPVPAVVPPVAVVATTTNVTSTNSSVATEAVSIPIVAAEPTTVPKPQIAASEPVKGEEIKPQPEKQTPVVATVPPPQAPAANETVSIAPVMPSAPVAPSAPAAPYASPEPKPEQAPVVEKATPPAPAIIAQTEAPSSLYKVLIAIGVLLFFILLVLVLMLRKSKHSQPSLITQSIDKSVP